MATPFFTVITATYNAGDTLHHLLDSLVQQTCRNFEIIIQDGASSDDTLVIAESYREAIPEIVIGSEPDTGIYDAWNKALMKSSGRWVIFLGADDKFAESSCLGKLRDALEKMPSGVKLVCGALHVFSPSGECIMEVVPVESNAFASFSSGVLPASHTAMLHRADLFTNNCFDTSYKIAGDYEFLCRTIRSDDEIVLLPMRVSIMGSGGMSASPATTLRMRWEYLQSMKRHFPEQATFRSTVLPVLKACIVQTIYWCLGLQRSTRLLDTLRVVRGLPPVWAKQIKKSD